MPTPTGWRLLILGVAAALGGRAFGILELHVIGATAVAAVVVALAVRLLHPSRLAVERRVASNMVAVSEHLTVTLDIANRARLRSPAVRIREQVSGAADVHLVLASMPGGASATGRYGLQATRRGVLEIGPLQLDDIDGLGLARRRRPIARRTRVIVHPTVEALAPARVPVGQDLSAPSEFRRRSVGLDSDDFDILRPYVSGDDPRHIHWRSTARFDDLMIRRFQPARPGRLRVVIDTRPPGDREAQQDLTTSVAASVISAVLRSGDEARIITTDGRSTPMLAHATQIGAALEFLALLAGGRTGIDVEMPTDGSVVVAVSASPDAIDESSARSMLARRLRASLVITCGAGHKSSPAPGADIAGGWIHLTGPGQLAGLWRMPVPAIGAATAP